MQEIWVEESRDAANKSLDVLLARGFSEYSTEMKKLEKKRKELCWHSMPSR
ncbi:MAG: hypothetical protein ACTS8R_06040 [Arsenophonus sp. NC-QC1-MAG3]